MQPHGFDNLGGQDKPVDTRDVKLGAAAAIKYTFPPSLTSKIAWSAPVEYQQQQPACGAHAGSSLKTVDEATHFTPRFTWSDIKSFDGMPIDWGTDMRSIFKSLTKDGTLEFPLMGNDASLDTNTYAHPHLTVAMKDNATSHSGGGYGFITDLTFNGIKQFLYDHGPSILLFRVGKEMWTAPSGQTSWAEKDVLPLRPPQSVVSGHFVLAHSYDQNYVYFLNSWSDQWGRKGHGYFGENYMPFVNDVGAMFPLSYTHDLQIGMTEPDVKRLQQQLNKSTATLVATSGAGSPGQETTYFGTLTQNAVKRYQKIKGINQTGYVGPLTRAQLSL